MYTSTFGEQGFLWLRFDVLQFKLVTHDRRNYKFLEHLFKYYPGLLFGH